MDRRKFIAGALSFTACRRGNQSLPNSLAIVANREGKALAVVDLRAFAAIRHIHLNGHPSVLSVLPNQKILALTPSNGKIHKVDVTGLKVEKSRQVAHEATTMTLSPDRQALYVLADHWFIRVNPETMVPEWQLGLPEKGASFTLSPETPHAAITSHQGRITLIDLSQRRIMWQWRVTETGGPVRFLKNGNLLLAGSRTENKLSILDTLKGKPVVELPLSISPENFCFKQDGGQLFITGKGQDAVVVVYPFQTQVAGTILAGRLPGVMAASRTPDLLFIANPESGQVTVMDIRTHKIRAVVPVGQAPSRVVVTPDNNFALVLNRESGDVAVIRVDAMAGRRSKAAPLFTMIPVGSEPVDAVFVDV